MPILYILFWKFASLFYHIELTKLIWYTFFGEIMKKTMLLCDFAKRCNSCQLNNLSYEEQLLFKEKKCKTNLRSICKVSPIISMEKPFSYRNKAQVCVKVEKDKSYSYGMYKSTTKSITKIDCCRLHTEKANKIIAKVVKLLKSFKVIPYDFHTKKGYLKSIMVREGFKSGEIMLIFSGKTDTFPAKSTFTSALQKNCPEITTAVVTQNDIQDKINVGKTVQVLFGKGYIEDTLLEKRFIISPESFYQINPTQTEKLYKTAIDFADIEEGKVVLDAYCGIGTIGIIASEKAKTVYAVEKNEKAIENAEQNAKLNGIENIEFFCDDAKNFAKKIIDENIKIDTVFIDPPRSGCSKEFLSTLCEINAEKIVYVSCNVETQARDLRYLIKAGYKAEKCTPVDMFPHTNHVETIVLMTKKNS